MLWLFATTEVNRFTIVSCASPPLFGCDDNVNEVFGAFTLFCGAAATAHGGCLGAFLVNSEVSAKASFSVSLNVVDSFLSVFIRLRKR